MATIARRQSTAGQQPQHQTESREAVALRLSAIECDAADCGSFAARACGGGRACGYAARTLPVRSACKLRDAAATSNGDTGAEYRRLSGPIRLFETMCEAADCGSSIVFERNGCKGSCPREASEGASGGRAALPNPSPFPAGVPQASGVSRSYAESNDRRVPTGRTTFTNPSPASRDAAGYAWCKAQASMSRDVRYFASAARGLVADATRPTSASGPTFAEAIGRCHAVGAVWPRRSGESTSVEHSNDCCRSQHACRAVEQPLQPSKAAAAPRKSACKPVGKLAAAAASSGADAEANASASGPASAAASSEVRCEHLGAVAKNIYTLAQALPMLGHSDELPGRLV